LRKAEGLLIISAIKTLKDILNFAAGLNQGGQRDAVTLLFLFSVSNKETFALFLPSM